MKKERVEQIASELVSWMQDAAGDLAHASMHGFADPKWGDKIKQAKENGVLDIQGWLADEFYDDVDTLCDMLGDRIYDESHGDDWAFVEIAWEMRKYGHRGMVLALERLILNKIKQNNKDGSQLGFVLFAALTYAARRVMKEDAQDAPITFADQIIKEMED